MSSNKTVCAKETFEHENFSGDNGVTICHYHTNNGHFKDNEPSNIALRPVILFLSAGSMRTSKTVSLRKLSAISLKYLRIRSSLPSRDDLKRSTYLFLWSCALCEASFIDYMVPNNDEGLSKLDVFANLRIKANLKLMHFFGLPGLRP